MSMIVFREPATIALVAGTALSAVGTVASARGQAQNLETQAEMEALAARREVRDEREENRRRLARTRALLSAGGADVGAILSLTSAQGGESLIRQQRTLTDSRTRRSTLRARAGNVRRAGTISATGSLLSGTGRAFGE